MCGSILEVSGQDDGRRSSCPVCLRRFDVRFTVDVAGGRKGVSLQYLADSRKRGETSTVSPGTTSFFLDGPDPSAATHGLLMEPELPDEAHFRCSCKALLVIPKALYEKRSKCPSCGARMLMFLFYDAGARSFTLQQFSLIDRGSGSTRILNAL